MTLARSSRPGCGVQLNAIVLHVLSNPIPFPAAIWMVDPPRTTLPSIPENVGGADRVIVIVCGPVIDPKEHAAFAEGVVAASVRERSIGPGAASVSRSPAIVGIAGKMTVPLITLKPT